MAEAISQEVLARAVELQRQAAADAAARQKAAADAAAAEAEAVRPNTWTEAALNAPVQLLSGAVGLGQAAYGVANLASLGTLDRATDFSQNFRQTQDVLSTWQSAPTQRAAQRVNQAFDQEGIAAGLGEAVTSPAFLQQAILGTLPSLLPATAGARLAATTTAEYATARGLGEVAANKLVSRAAERGVLTATGAQIGGGTNIDAINAIEQAGGDETQQQLGGLAAGALAAGAGVAIGKLTGAAALEGRVANLLPGGAAGSGAATAGGVISGVAAGAAREGVEEAAQSASEQIAQNVVTPGKDLFAGVGQQAAIGGLLGAILGGPLGGASALSAPRASDSTALGQNLQDQLDATNAQMGNPLAPSALSPQVDGANAIRSLYDITGRRPQTQTAPAPVQEAAPEPTGLLGAIDRVRNEQGRAPIPLPDGNTVYGTNVDVGATPLPTVQPDPNVENIDVGTAPLPTIQPDPNVENVDLGSVPVPNDPSIVDYTDVSLPGRDVPLYPVNNEPVAPLPKVEEVAPPSLKKYLAQDLGLKPANFRGKVWDEFEARATAAGITPQDPGFADFLRSQAPTLVADPATAPLFAGKISEKYGPPAEQVPDPLAPSVVADLGANPPGSREQEVLPGFTVPEPVRNEGQAPVDPIATIVRQAQEQTDAATVAQALNPPVPVQPLTPGAPAIAQPKLAVDQQIVSNLRMDPTISRPQAAADAYSDAIMGAPSPAELDETFIGIKNHSDWSSLSKAQQDQVVNDFNQRYDGMEAGRFDRLAGPRGGDAIPLPRFLSLVEAAKRGRGAGDPEIVGLDNVLAYEVQTGRAAPPDARGVFSDGNIYLIRENITSPEQLAITLAHERGHHGLSALLGDRLPAVVNRLWTNPATRERIKAKMRDLSASADPDPRNGSLRRLAGEEVLADMFAAGEKVNGDVLTKARAAIENSFATLLGVGSLRMKNSEVDALLQDVGAVLQGRSPVAKRSGEPTHEALPYMMADPRDYTDSDARFSRSFADLDRISDAALRDGDGSRRNLADVAKDVGELAIDKVRSMGTATARDKTRGLLLDATPLSQIANLYSKMFDGGIAQFARLKRAKEAMHNQILTREATLKYGDMDVTTSPVQLAQAWNKYNNASPAKRDALNNLQQTATLYRLFPDRAYDKQPAVDHTTSGYTAEERKQAFQAIQKLWRSIGTDGQGLYRQSQAIYQRLWQQRFDALGKSIAQSTGVQQFMTDANGQPVVDQSGKPVMTDEFWREYGQTIDAAMRKINAGPYSPLQRYGDYLVTVRDSAGKVAWFSGHDTIEEAASVEKDLKAGEFAGPDYRVARTRRQEYNYALDGINQQTIENIERAVDTLPSTQNNPQLSKEIRQGLVEAYLQNLPQSSFLQHANQRKNIRGATTDAFRAFNDYSTKASRSISSLAHDGEISAQLTQLQGALEEKARQPDANGDELTKMSRVLDAVRQQHVASQSFERSKVADMLSQGGFLWFMSSPSQLFINALQTPMVTLPRLAADYGNASAIKSLRSALSQFAKSGFDLRGSKSVLPQGSTERKVMEALYERGTLDFTLAHDMNGLANGEGSAMSGHWRKVMEVAGWAMQKSEVFNRQVTALAATKAELERLGNPTNVTDAQFAQIADAAEDSVLNSHFDYSQSNKPKLMQGPWRKVIFQFQQYRANMLAMMAKDIRDSFAGTKEEKQSARRALSWMIGTQMAITGAAGTVLAPIAFAIADLWRDDDDLLDSRTEFLRATPQWLAHGILAGAVDTQRVGANTLLSLGGEYAPKGATAKETFNYYVLANLGPAVGLGANMATGVEAMLKGDHVKAAKNLLPAGFRDPYKAYFEGQQGAKDSRQVVYYEPNIWDTVTSAVGLRSGDRRSAEELRGASYEANVAIDTRQKRLLGRLAVGHALSDQDMINDAQEGIRNWNAKYPDQPIKASRQVQAVLNRVRSQINATEYGIATPRAPSASVREVIGL